VDIILKNGRVITGDSVSVLDMAWIGIDGSAIAAVSREEIPHSLEKSCRVIDVAGSYILPGLINTHTHGCTIGPLFSSGALPLSREEAVKNAKRHLSQGTTTLVNMCGLPLMDELMEVVKSVPLRLFCGTSHFPSTFEAAKLVDGKGLQPRHLAATAAGMLREGAVAIGEVGSGASLGGGVSFYKYIPEAIERETGIRLSSDQAMALRNAASMKEEKVLAEEMKNCGIKKTSPARIAQIISDIVEKPVHSSLNSFDEAARLGAETRVPVIFHAADVSAERILEVARRFESARPRFIAAHCNHPSCDPEECVAWARKFKDAGVTVDVSSLCAISSSKIDFITNIKALLSEGLADTMTTDYGGGNWDGMLELMQNLTAGEPRSLANLVGLATGKAVEAFPCFAGRGILAEGQTADIVVADRSDISRVTAVFIDGKVVQEQTSEFQLD